MQVTVCTMLLSVKWLQEYLPVQSASVHMCSIALCQQPRSLHQASPP